MKQWQVWKKNCEDTEEEVKAQQARAEEAEEAVVQLKVDLQRTRRELIKARDDRDTLRSAVSSVYSTSLAAMKATENVGG